MFRARDVADAGLPPQAKEVIGLAVAWVLLAAVIVSLRFYTRGILLRVLGCEDWLIGLALVSRISASLIVLRPLADPLTEAGIALLHQ